MDRKIENKGGLMRKIAISTVIGAGVIGAYFTADKALEKEVTAEYVGYHNKALFGYENGFDVTTKHKALCDENPNLVLYLVDDNGTRIETGKKYDITTKLNILKDGRTIKNILPTDTQN